MLKFERETFHARIVLPTGEVANCPIEIRTHPITGRTCRITYSRAEESEPETAALPEPPPFAAERETCPFCRARLASHTPQLAPALCPQGRMTRGSSTLFPNLFPYGRYSAVSLFDDDHFVEIGTARQPRPQRLQPRAAPVGRRVRQPGAAGDPQRSQQLCPLGVQ